MGINPDRGVGRAGIAPVLFPKPMQHVPRPRPIPDPRPMPYPPIGHVAPPAEQRTEVIRNQPDHRDGLHQQRQRFGGIQWGSAFFGWLTATGTALILTGLAVGAVVGLSIGGDGRAGTPAGQAAQNPTAAQNAGTISAIVMLVILVIAYYCGGYVASRMARFSGVKQGLAVWLWSIIIAVVVAIALVVAGAQLDVVRSLSGLSAPPVGGSALTVGWIMAVVVGLVASLVGAILGGMAGMRFHRRVDRTGPEGHLS